MTTLLSNTPNKQQIIIYKADDGQTQVDVRMEEDTVWLTAHQMAVLFKMDRTGIVRHMHNIYKSGELEPKSTCAKIAQVAKDGRTREMDFYNLDMIISVGYRVNSKRGTQFRIWATSVLRKHLVEGYSLHRKRLQEKGIKELEQAIALVKQTTAAHAITGDEARGLLAVITEYTQTWIVLRQYDDGQVEAPIRSCQEQYVLTYEDAIEAVTQLRDELKKTKEASDLFGMERSEMLRGIVGNLYQTFDGQNLYPSMEEKAAHLLYFVIKDHPFTDGNKRSAALLFLHFLDRNAHLRRADRSLRIEATTLTALALLIAESRPEQKDVMLQLILRLMI